MPPDDYTLTPVDHDPYTHTPVDYDPFAAEKYVNPLVKGAIGSAADLVAGPGKLAYTPNPYPAGSEEAQFFEDSRTKAGQDWANNAALATMGTGAVAGVPVQTGETILGAGTVRGVKSGMDYPIAPRSEWYGDANYETTGGHMTTMAPDDFLANARPMKIDEVARENIDDLKAHMQSGKTLDPLALYKNGKEDGRHRAIAAKELGIKEVPVLNWRVQPVDHNPFAGT